MTKFRITVFLTFILLTDAYCQNNNTVEMADVLRQDGKIYTVVFGLLVILTGLIIFLIKVDKKIFKLEKNIKDQENLTVTDAQNIHTLN